MAIPRLITRRLHLIPELLFCSGLQGGCLVVGIMGAWTRIDDSTSGRRSPKPRANVALMRARQTALSGWPLLGQTLRQDGTRGGVPGPKRGPDRRGGQGADRGPRGSPPPTPITGPRSRRGGVPQDPGPSTQGGGSHAWGPDRCVGGRSQRQVPETPRVSSSIVATVAWSDHHEMHCKQHLAIRYPQGQNAVCRK